MRGQIKGKRPLYFITAFRRTALTVDLQPIFEHQISEYDILWRLGLFDIQLTQHAEAAHSPQF